MTMTPAMVRPLDDAALNQLFRDARTCYSYTADPVTDADLTAIWDLAKMAPTSANSLPMRVLWCRSREAKERLAGFCMEANAEKVREAPVTAIVGMDLRFYDLLPELFPHADAKSWFDGNPPLAEATAFRNSSLQGAYLILAARALGFATGPMSGYDAPGVDAAFFGDAPSVRSNFIMTLGRSDGTEPYPRGPRPAFDRFNSIL